MLQIEALLSIWSEPAVWEFYQLAKFWAKEVTVGYKNLQIHITMGSLLHKYNFLHVCHVHMNISSVAMLTARQCTFKVWKTSPITFSLKVTFYHILKNGVDLTFNFANISDYTQQVAVNGVLFFLLWHKLCQHMQIEKIFTYAQKSSTVSNFEIRRRFACQVLLLSFLKNQSAHLKENKIK